MITAKCGKIEGVDRGNYMEYRGIPYAKAPVGDLRWKKPVRLGPWKDIYQATGFRNRCMQEDFVQDPFTRDFYSNPEYDRPMSEDCLYLHIWTPKDVQEGKLPVAFWIHGGAFLRGYSSEMEMDGEAYCKRGVILVSVEYRCIIFGFFSHPWLSEESEYGSSGNYGLLDQIAALDWVYENIAAFGGNPDNITVFGQSAGAISTQALVSSDLTGNKIAKAIMQSGACYQKGLDKQIPVLELQKVEEIGKKFTDYLGTKSLEELRSIPAEQILKASNWLTMEVFPELQSLFMSPCQDGYVLKSGYYTLMDLGKIKNIPYLLGTTKHDLLVTDEMLREGKYSELYEGTILFSQKLEQLGYNPAYVYYFSRHLPGDEYGAWHTADLWYTFGTLERCWRPWEQKDYELSDQMLSYWTDFMKKGNPNGGNRKEWSQCTVNNPFVFEFSGN